MLCQIRGRTLMTGRKEAPRVAASVDVAALPEKRTGREGGQGSSQRRRGRGLRKTC